MKDKKNGLKLNVKRNVKKFDAAKLYDYMEESFLDAVIRNLKNRVNKKNV